MGGKSGDTISRKKDCNFLLKGIAKWQDAKEWVNAVNAEGEFGKWEFKLLDDTKNIFDVVI